MTAAEKEFDRKIKELEKNEGFSFKGLIKHPPASVGLVSQANEQGVFVPELYKLHNGIEFSWKHDTETHTVGGSLNIPSIQILMGGFSSKSASYKRDTFKEYFVDESSSKSQEITSRLHVFDMDNYENYSVGIDLEYNGRLYCSKNFRLYELSIGVEDYYQLSLNMLGISFWQFQFVKKPDANSEGMRDTFRSVYKELLGENAPTTAG